MSKVIVVNVKCSYRDKTTIVKTFEIDGKNPIVTHFKQIIDRKKPKAKWQHGFTKKSVEKQTIRI